MREIKFRIWDRMFNRFATADAMLCRASFNPDGSVDVLDRCDISEFTGLRDKNGKEIYEGDMIRCPAMTYVVEFENGRFGGRNKKHPKVLFSFESMPSIEVVGNIYENADLLQTSDSVPLRESP